MEGMRCRGRDRRMEGMSYRKRQKDGRNGVHRETETERWKE